MINFEAISSVPMELTNARLIVIFFFKSTGFISIYMYIFHTNLYQGGLKPMDSFGMW